jgi:transmembrane sensor
MEGLMMEPDPGPVDDPVVRLVRLADAGPELPAGGSARVKEAIRPQWERDVRGRSRRRFIAAAASLAAAAAIAAIAIPRLLPSAAPGPPVATVDRVDGAIAMQPGMLLVAGSEIDTGTARVALRLQNGASLRLDRATRVAIASAEELQLLRGAVYVDDANAGPSMAVVTAAGTVREIGTQFEVRDDGRAVSIKVREGAVLLSTRDGGARIGQGTELVVARDGTRRTSAVRPDADAWNWTRAVAPRFAIEGKTVDAFLAWAARETGVAVRFHDSETERLAATARLHGDLGDLAPDEAPPVILPSAGLEARREPGGVLVIRRIPPP